MKFEIVSTRQAEIELFSFPTKILRQIMAKIVRLQHGFTGAIKKLQATDNIDRLRSGDFRILFEVEGATLVIRTLRDRKAAYE